jgi:hypothetical protein
MGVCFSYEKKKPASLPEMQATAGSSRNTCFFYLNRFRYDESNTRERKVVTTHGKIVLLYCSLAGSIGL